jgi:two-component system response regulator QseB
MREPLTTFCQRRVLLAVSPQRATPGVLRSLRSHSFDPTVLHDGDRALDSLRATTFAAVVLEVGLTGPDTGPMLAELARLAPDTPVLALTSREGRDELVGGLRGARDDFLTIPFNPDELVARLRLRVPAADLAGRSVVRHGDITVDTALGLVSVDGQLVTLSPTEFGLLTILMSNPDRALSRVQLAEMLWPEPPSSNVVEVYVGYLRRKIGPDRIRTVRGKGYLLED